MEKITVKEFIEKYKNRTIKIEDIITDTYTPYLKKKTMVEVALHKSLVVENGIEYIDDSIAHVNLVLNNFLMHTCLIIDAENPYEDYDLLTLHGIINRLKVELPSVEINELYEVEQAIRKKYYDLNQTPSAYISKQFTALGKTLEAIVEGSKESLSKFEGLKEAFENEEFTNALAEMVNKDIK